MLKKYKCQTIINNMKPICVLYSPNFGSAERNFYMPRLTEIIVKTEFLMSLENVKTLQIKTTDRESPLVKAENIKVLTRMKNRCNVRVFSSALGSGIVKYLNDIFFSKNLDCLHINSFSTVASLSTIPNLMRLVPPDTLNKDIFVRLTKKYTGTAFLMYDNGAWSSGLSTSIASSFKKLYSDINVINTPFNIREMTDKVLKEKTDELVIEMNEAIEDTDLTLMLIYVIDGGSRFFNTLANNPDVPEKMHILGGDAGAFGSRTDFFKKHSARVIQPFRGRDPTVQKKLQEKLELSLIVEGKSDKPEPKVSSLITNTVSCIDLAYYIAQLPPENRLERTRYMDIIFDKNLDILNGIYGVDDFIDSDLTYSIAAVYGDKLYITEIIS
jgi:hypothetical protein